MQTAAQRSSGRLHKIAPLLHSVLGPKLHGSARMITLHEETATSCRASARRGRPHFAALLRERANARPHERAYSIARDGRWVHFTAGELEAASDAVAHQLAEGGLAPGQRVLILVPPGFEFFTAFFATMKVGAVPVLVDTSAGLAAFERCLRDTNPTAMISTSTGHLFRWLHRATFRPVRLAFTFGHVGGRRLRLTASGAGPFPLRSPPGQEPAAILFTSGSTGTPKGARYSHLQFVSLVAALRRELAYQPGAADLTTFPVLGLFAPILGGTSVLPEMDFRHPSRADTSRLLDAVETMGCSTMFGSSLLVEKLCAEAQRTGRGASLRRVMTAGAPPSARLLGWVQSPTCSTGPRLVIPYGSTECLLVAVADSTTLPPPGPLGVCVGRPVAGVDVRIIELTDAPISTWRPGLELPRGRIGEITVSGPLVSRGYEGRADLTALAKIQDGDRLVHRMGDLGALDEQGRLWIAGRKQHRVPTPGGDVFPLVVEELANAEPGVSRSALVWVDAEPWVLLELEGGADRTRVIDGVRRRLANESIHVGVVSKPFPVDRRHEVKIDREALGAQWHGRRS